MPKFLKTLRSNEIFASIANMIISQEVAADNIKGTNAKLLNAARVDVGLYGDQKLYYAADVIHSNKWDGKDTNVLETNRPADPQCQAIVIDKFRQIPLTVDSYLSKRAWSTEGAFSTFNSVLLQLMRDSKRIHDSTTYNAFLGTDKPVKATQVIELDLTGKSDEEQAKLIAQALADLTVAMEDPSREFNDYGFMRSYDESELKFVWNSKHVNKIRKVDLPTIFHSEGLMGDKFAQYVLPAKYFGTPTVFSDPSKVDYDVFSKLRLIEEVGETIPFKSSTGYPSVLHPGFAGEKASANTAGGTCDLKAAGIDKLFYEEDPDIICKVYTKLPPFMSSMEVGTSFYNAKSLSENHYLTWGYNTLEHLSNYPCIVIKQKAAA